MQQLNCKLYYQQLNFKYLCNLASYWLQTPWGWHDSVETCRNVIICEIIMHFLVIAQSNWHLFRTDSVCTHLLYKRGILRTWFWLDVGKVTGSQLTTVVGWSNVIITIPVAEVELPLNNSICRKGNGNILASTFHNYGSDRMYHLTQDGDHKLALHQRNTCRNTYQHSIILTKIKAIWKSKNSWYNPYPTAFPYGNGIVLHFYQQQESSTTKTVHKFINKGLKAYV